MYDKKKRSFFLFSSHQQRLFVYCVSKFSQNTPWSIAPDGTESDSVYTAFGVSAEQS